ncbi:MAG: 3-deoxy-manno-octulosonate-8-phosphatase KdsC [Gammaproteobacteria bacterium]|jgi:3-deoxy-D-manno-octulosonate 8-phosphate phosphatase (KDO 8-P phosphatase)|nr:3-deoxy-manno-octulosonate-8-phosphatase KdsC [Gammaproteobacteria bacterium]MBT6043116.1 3-deoxy-manno-octulosonate-8-phosphatase KdsC [Gammaproteobacteria bacterium]
MSNQNHINTLAADIKLLVLDVDGVMTDGKLYFSNNGEEIKAFNTMDGLGLKMLQNAGIKVALITGRQSEIVAVRAKNLGIKHVYQGRDDKLNILEELLNTLGMEYSQVAYAGDDLPDLACITQVKMGITVPNGHFLVKDAADAITSREGGNGAVREICDWILQAQEKFDDAVSPFL